MRFRGVRNWLLLAACLPAHAATETSMPKTCCALQVEARKHHGVASFFYRYGGQAATSGVGQRAGADARSAEPASIKTGSETGRPAKKHHRFHRRRRHDANSDRAFDASTDAAS